MVTYDKFTVLGPKHFIPVLVLHSGNLGTVDKDL